MALAAADRAAMASTVAAFLPDRADVLRITGGSAVEAGALRSATTVAGGVPCRLTPIAMEDYPFAAIPNQPQTRWDMRLPADADVRNNDILSLDGGQRLFVVVRTAVGRSDQLTALAHGLLSATQGQLADAYLRPNATVSSTRPSTVGGIYSGYDARRVHLAYAQANPAASLERLTGGVATLRIALFDLPDADWRQGDGLQILSQDGTSVLPAEIRFTLAGVIRRPLPFCICEADLVTDI